ncbi:hypothetical protein JIX56_00855 [Streptomyces sp. CA-210063]|uniref:hypothetical protein n=1 Tax=Streptomyces sp. CA-210063 TaxID=2801029 RepID=UPI00214B745E|nr:hypothetical protein [Streptomyces sp. CA-210063]UUU28566.1 hypothetical protein JIX56_00855 [Streptomyces sp. CA-210063]
MKGIAAACPPRLRRLPALAAPAAEGVLELAADVQGSGAATSRQKACVTIKVASSSSFSRSAATSFRSWSDQPGESGQAEDVSRQ